MLQINKILQKGLAAAILLLPFFYGTAQAEGLKLITDEETENILDQIISPLMQKAAQPYSRGHIHIIEDNSLNAFVADGNHLFINTGTLIKADNVNELAGVIAHEIGHIKGGHILRQKLEIREMNSLSLLSAALAGTAGILSGRADAAFAILLGGQSSALNKFVHYRANEERAADETAVKLLKATGQSPKGILAFMKKIAKQNSLSGKEETPYFRTHPMTPERIAFFEKAVENNNLPTTSKYDNDFKRVQIKLKAYLDNPKTIISELNRCADKIDCQYGLAIAYFRNLQFERAFNIADRLVVQEPKNPYFYEIKGQMEMESGKIKQAQNSYSEAYKLAPLSNDIRFGYAFAILENNPSKQDAKKAIELLNAIILKDANNFRAWTMLAKAYGINDDMARANWAAAESLAIIGNWEAAERKLKEAEKLTPTPQLKIKIDDLKERIKQEKKKMD